METIIPSFGSQQHSVLWLACCGSVTSFYNLESGRTRDELVCLQGTDLSRMNPKRWCSSGRKNLRFSFRRETQEGRNWWPGTGSNRRHADFQSAALPAELPGQVTHGENDTPSVANLGAGRVENSRSRVTTEGSRTGEEAFGKTGANRGATCVLAYGREAPALPKLALIS